jgi:hypothetical protein
MDMKVTEARSSYWRGGSAIRMTEVANQCKECDIKSNFLRSVRRLLVAACVVHSSPIFVTLMKKAPGSSERSVLTRATRRNNPEDTILKSNIDFLGFLKSYISRFFLLRKVYCSVKRRNTLYNLKNVVFWDVTPRGSCKNRRFEGTFRQHYHGDKNRRRKRVSSN